MKRSNVTGWVLGIDVGGTKVHLAVAKDGEMVSDLRIETRAQEGAGQCLARIVSGAKELIQEQRGCQLRAIGLGSPGAVDPRTNQPSFTWNIPGWDNISVASEVQNALGAVVAMENDANMASIAELEYGNHTGDSFAFIAVGTGIGAGIVLNGQLWRGSHGAAGEIGRWVMAPSGLNPKYQESGHLEYMISGTGIKTRYQEISGKIVSGKEISKLADEGDVAAKRVLDEAATTLAIAIANLAIAVDLDTVVLGGGVITSTPERWLSAINSVAKQSCLYQPTIVVSELGDEAGLLGAVAQAYRFADEQEKARTGRA